VTSLDKAVNRIREILAPAQADRLARFITTIAGIKGADLKFRRIAQAPDVEALGDFSAEITFGLIFVGLRFEIEFEPLGEKGPDLLIARDGKSAYVEVKRFRPSMQPQEGARVPNDDLIFKAYGNPLKDIAKVRAELLGKFVQVGGNNGIVAFWSDNEGLIDLQFRFAVMDVLADFENEIQRVPEGFLFTVFGSDWKNVSKNQQLYCRALKPLAEPFSIWALELENATLTDCFRAAAGDDAVSAFFKGAIDMKQHEILKLRPEAASHVDKNGVRCNGTTFVVRIGDVGEVNDKSRSFPNQFECLLCKRGDLEFHNDKIADLTPAMR
jgi:hypothetical protein